MSDTFDKSSKLQIANEDLDQGAYKKTVDNKIARRVGNEPSNPLYVTAIDGPVEQDFFISDEASPVLKEVLTEVIRYQVPAGKSFNLDKILVSGDNIAKYTVTINNELNKTKRTYYGSSLNESFNYNSYKVNAEEIIKVEVIHYTDAQGSFEATIEGRLNSV